MDIVVYALLKKMISLAQLDTDNIRSSSDKKSIEIIKKDGTVFTVTIPNSVNDPDLLNKFKIINNELCFDGVPVKQFEDNEAELLKKFSVVGGKLKWNGQDIGSGADSGTADWTTNIACSGLDSGVNLTGMTALEILKKITRKYTNANATVTWSETNTLLEKGDTLNLNVSVSNFVAGDYAPSKVALYRGSTLLEEKAASGTVTFSTVSNITTDTTFTVKLTDANNVVTSISSKTYKFVYATYTGLAGTIPVLDTDVTALTKLIREKAPYTNTYAPANQYIVFAYPQSYGNLTSVIDGNGFENIGEYSKSVITINSVAYNVYCTTSKLTSTGLKYTFKY